MSRNPFDDDDEPGGFGSRSNAGFSNCNKRLGPNEISLSNNAYSMEAQLQDSQARTRASQQRALASIANSERVGVETAAELLEQGEKLSRAEQRLDEISMLQKDSQRQINTLSSIFGGIKTFFARKQSVPDSTAVGTSERKSADPQRPTSMLRHSVYSAPSWSNNVPTNDGISTTDKQGASDFERNLDLMSDGMSRLKGLAQGLNEELRLQNQQLDRMAPRVDAVTDTMTRQNQQMNKLLGVKPK